MQLLGLKDQREIVEVIRYLVEIYQKNDTVEDVMEKFRLSAEEYRMCCNLAVPALAVQNVKGRYRAVRKIYGQMRKDLKLLNEAVKDEDSAGARGVRMMMQTYCPQHTSNAVYGQAEDGDR